MHRVPVGFRKIDIVDGLRAGALVLLIVMAITFFTGCVTEKIDSEGNVIRKKRETKQEAGASYNR